MPCGAPACLPCRPLPTPRPRPHPPPRPRRAPFWSTCALRFSLPSPLPRLGGCPQPHLRPRIFLPAALAPLSLARAPNMPPHLASPRHSSPPPRMCTICAANKRPARSAEDYSHPLHRIESKACGASLNPPLKGPSEPHPTPCAMHPELAVPDSCCNRLFVPRLPRLYALVRKYYLLSAGPVGSAAACCSPPLRGWPLHRPVPARCITSFF